MCLVLPFEKMTVAVLWVGGRKEVKGSDRGLVWRALVESRKEDDDGWVEVGGRRDRKRNMRRRERKSEGWGETNREGETTPNCSRSV